MDFLKALHISASGMSAQRARVDLATSNLANAESTRTAEGGPYRRQDPVFESVSFDATLDGALGAGVRVAEVVKDSGPGRRVHQPGHPDADADGFVTLPDVDPIHEVVNLLSASRGHDANASAFETTKAMAQRALDILRG